VSLRTILALLTCCALAMAACSGDTTERPTTSGQNGGTGGTGGSRDAGHDADASLGGGGFGGTTEAGPPVEAAPAPAAPTALVIQIVDATTLKLTWVDNSGGAAAFEIRWATENAVPGPANVLVPAGGVEYQVTGLTTNQPYYFWVRAVADGVASDDVTGMKMPVTVPLKPGSFRAAPGPGGTATLSWSPVLGENGYNVYWAAYLGGDAGIPTKPATANKPLATGTTTFDVTGLDPCTTYFFWVEAFNDIAAGEASRTSAKPEIVPADPTNLVVDVVGTTATLTWTDNAINESDYIVSWASGTGAIKPVTGASAGAKDGAEGGTASYVITTLSPGLPYTVWVEAKNCVGASAAISGAANTIDLPPAPTTFAATVSGPASDVLHLTWVNVATAGDAGSTQAKGYRIYYSTAATLTAQTPKVDVAVTDTSADITGLTPLATYNFWIVAFNDSGESNPALTGKGSVGAKPAAPTGLVVDAATSKFRMTLLWQPPAASDGGASGTQSWKLDWTVNGLPANTAPVVLPVGTTSYALTQVNVGSTYVFSLKASNVVGDSDPITSAPANSFIIPGHTGNAIKEAWIEPNGYLHFAWYVGTAGDAVGATTYTAYYNTTPTVPAAGFPTQTALATKTDYYWATTGFLATTTRYLWGGAAGADGTLLWPCAMTPGPNMTGAITFSGATDTSITVTWPAVTGAQGYRVRWSTDTTKPSDNPHAAFVAAPTTTYTVTGLLSGTDYHVWVESSGAGIFNGAVSPLGLPGAVAITGLGTTAGTKYVLIPTAGLPAFHNATFGITGAVTTEVAPSWADANAWDGNAITKWGYDDGKFTNLTDATKVDQFGAPVNPPWVGVDLGAAAPAVASIIMTWTNARSYAYKLEGSASQTGPWTTLLNVCNTGGSCATPTATVGETPMRFIFTNTTAYRYIRLVMPSALVADYSNLGWGAKFYEVALYRAP
jgi:large repetitive protein